MAKAARRRAVALESVQRFILSATDAQ